MKKFTLLEFQDYCYEHSFMKYSFVTDAQKWDSVFNPLRINIKCDSMSACLHPNMVCFFQKDRCLLHLNSVKFIKLINDMERNVFEIICGDKYSNSRDISYIVEAD